MHRFRQRDHPRRTHRGIRFITATLFAWPSTKNIEISWLLSGGIMQAIQRGDGCQSCQGVRLSQPFSVTSTVCSNWAEREPSRVTAVQLPPRFGFLTAEVDHGLDGEDHARYRVSPSPFRPKCGTWGGSWKSKPMPCPTNSRTTEQSSDSA